MRYTLSGELPPAYACHCRECKKQTSSAFSMSAVVAFARISVRGEPKCHERTAHSGASKQCYFCPDCGTRLWNRSSASPGKVTLKIGTLDDSAAIVPQGHLWLSYKQAGIFLDPDVPGFDTQPDDLSAWRESL
ncbi:GFA family protein [Sphingobium sp. Sx8-8]|uniref:GFA family protein n=1 Tax=Sphingobium sp. Sx8-8 TaxID=2933617 RepID=UPI001F5678DD